jgi:hypothetical protein
MGIVKKVDSFIDPTPFYLYTYLFLLVGLTKCTAHSRNSYF